MDRGEKLVVAAFLTNAVLAGGNGVAIRFSNRELEPLWGATLRFVFASLLLGLLMAVMRVGIPRGRALTGSVLYGLFQFAGAFGLAYYALVRMHAGLGQTLLALVPLATLLLAVAWRQERLHAPALLGTLIGIGGVVLVVTARRAAGDAGAPLLSVLAALGSVYCFAQAAVIVRRFPSVHPVAMNGVGMAVSTVALLLASFVAAEAHPIPDRAETWAAVAYVSAIGSVVVFLLYVFVLHQWAASRAVYVMLIIPFVTVALSAWLDDEPIGGGFVLGGLLVIAGVYIGALRPAQRSPARVPAEAET